MYIPLSFFSSQADNCIVAQGGDEIGTFQSGSSIYQYHKFSTTGSASFVVTQGSLLNAQILLVGGGAGGGQSINTTILSSAGAGGGGGGGVFFANNLQLQPGVYDLFIGSGSAPNFNGGDTWFETTQVLTQSGSYYPTANKLTAVGGGRGAYSTYYWSQNQGFYPADSGGSGGGGAKFNIQGIGGSGTRRVTTNGALPAITGQGNRGGNPGGSTADYGNGGGGAGTIGTDSPSLGAPFATTGGDGIGYNVNGTTIYFGAGGGGIAGSSVGLGGLGSGNPGAGGSGSHDGTGGGLANSKTYGKAGVAYIIYPLCSTALDCTQYVVEGGVSGGLFNYVPCGATSPVSFSIDTGSVFYAENSICAANVAGYPTGTGTVSWTTTGSCSTYIEPTNTPTCPSGSVLEPAYIYNWTVTGSNTTLPYEAQPVVQLTYRNIYDENIVEYVNNPYGNETTGQIRAKELPTPTISIVTGTGTTSISKGSVDGFYCANVVGQAWEVQVSNRFNDTNSNFWYVNTSGSIVNTLTVSTTPTTIISQNTNLSTAGSDPIGYENNLVTQVIRPLNIPTTPYPYSGSYRNYKVTLNQYDSDSGYYNTYYNIMSVRTPGGNYSGSNYAYLWGQSVPDIPAYNNTPYAGKVTYVNSYNLPYQEYRAFSSIEDMGSVISGSCLSYLVFDNAIGANKTYRYKNCAGNSITSSITNTSASVCVFADTFISGGNGVSIIPLNTICT
jgi:hypothetical protein